MCSAVLFWFVYFKWEITIKLKMTSFPVSKIRDILDYGNKILREWNRRYEIIIMPNGSCK
jgi:hypothetical protein